MDPIETLHPLDLRFWQELRAFRLVADQDLAAARAALSEADGAAQRAMTAERTFLAYLEAKHGTGAVVNPATGEIRRAESPLLVDDAASTGQAAEVDEESHAG